MWAIVTNVVAVSVLRSNEADQGWRNFARERDQTAYKF